jgi:hypothetical protein
MWFYIGQPTKPPPKTQLKLPPSLNNKVSIHIQSSHVFSFRALQDCQFRGKEGLTVGTLRLCLSHEMKRWSKIVTAQLWYEQALIYRHSILFITTIIVVFSIKSRMKSRKITLGNWCTQKRSNLKLDLESIMIEEREEIKLHDQTQT